MSEQLVRGLGLLTAIMCLFYVSVILPEAGIFTYIFVAFVGLGGGTAVWIPIAEIWNSIFGISDNRFFLKKILAPIVVGAILGFISFTLTGEFSFGSGGAIFGTLITVVVN